MISKTIWLYMYIYALFMAFCFICSLWALSLWLYIWPAAGGREASDRWSSKKVPGHDTSTFETMIQAASVGAIPRKIAHWSSTYLTWTTTCVLYFFVGCRLYISNISVYMFLFTHTKYHPRNLCLVFALYLSIWEPFLGLYPFCEYWWI